MEQQQLCRLTCYKKYINFEFVNKSELNHVIDYICGNLNSYCYYPYWYDLYCYTSKSRIVLRHKEKNNEEALVKLGQCVCQDQVIDFLENSNKCFCSKGCSSVYFKVIF